VKEKRVDDFDFGEPEDFDLQDLPPEAAGYAEDFAAATPADLAAGLLELQQDLRHGLVALGQKITRLEHDFETRIMYDQSKDQTIDALHRELQDYRDGLEFKHLRPLVNDLLTIHDDLADLLETFSAQNPELASDGPVAFLLDNLLTLQEDIGGTLEKYGFELYEHPGEEIDRKIQRVQGTVPTQDLVLDRTLARRLRKGVRYEDRVVRPEIVLAYRLSESDA
jgi:molecular chaperone GrpE (heat shock protein)